MISCEMFITAVIHMLSCVSVVFGAITDNDMEAVCTGNAEQYLCSFVYMVVYRCVLHDHGHEHSFKRHCVLCVWFAMPWCDDACRDV